MGSQAGVKCVGLKDRESRRITCSLRIPSVHTFMFHGKDEFVPDFEVLENQAEFESR